MTRAGFSKKDFERLGELTLSARDICTSEQIPTSLQRLGQIIPHEFSACIVFNLFRASSLSVTHSDYPQEFCHLYTSQALQADPAVHHLLTTPYNITSSADRHILEPKAITGLKLDFGIKSCISAGVRGIQGFCTYWALSNFDQRLHAKLRTVLDVVTPHFHLAYLRSHSPQQSAHQPPPACLSKREQEIMTWVTAGKTNWEISVILGVSLNTVKFHLKNIYDKVGAENRWTAIAHWQWSEANRFPLMNLHSLDIRPVPEAAHSAKTMFDEPQESTSDSWGSFGDR